MENGVRKGNEKTTPKKIPKNTNNASKVTPKMTTKADLFLKNKPKMEPSSCTPTFSAAGTLGNPGICIISPVSATINSAPALKRTSRTGRIWPVGAPNAFGSAERPWSLRGRFPVI